MRSSSRYVPDPCPNCGKPNSATRGSSDWGHTHYCCSDECGRAFRSSSTRAAKEVADIQSKIRYLQSDLDSWQQALREALAREASGE